MTSDAELANLQTCISKINILNAEIGISEAEDVRQAAFIASYKATFSAAIKNVEMQKSTLEEAIIFFRSEIIEIANELKEEDRIDTILLPLENNNFSILQRHGLLSDARKYLLQEKASRSSEMESCICEIKKMEEFVGVSSSRMDDTVRVLSRANLTQAQSQLAAIKEHVQAKAAEMNLALTAARTRCEEMELGLRGAAGCVPIDDDSARLFLDITARSTISSTDLFNSVYEASFQNVGLSPMAFMIVDALVVALANEHARRETDLLRLQNDVVKSTCFKYFIC
jgi:hypothetical protein